MIVAEYEYGFFPVAVGVAGAIGAGGIGFLLGRKISKNEYYDCLGSMVDKGATLEEAKSICSVPYQSHSLPLLLTLGAIGAYLLFNMIRRE